MTFLDHILKDVAEELSATKLRRSAADIRSMLGDAPPVRSLADSLSQGFGLIAEVKECSPSVGPMRSQNVADALPAYEDAPFVRGISVLTNYFHFGMTIERLQAARGWVSKPLLRKDFIIEEYQIREARAFGVDAILLMANVLDASRLSGFFDLAQELGLEVLFEVHTEEEIDMLPVGVRLAGINSRKFKSNTGFVGAKGASEKDFSLDYGAFDLVDKLPAGALRVAESGISPKNVRETSERFNAVLVGTSLLRDERGIRTCLQEFEDALHV